MIDILFQEQDGFGRVIAGKTIDDRSGRLADRSSRTVEPLEHDQARCGLRRDRPQDETHPDELHSMDDGSHRNLLLAILGSY
jgi:hypothetical protein